MKNIRQWLLLAALLLTSAVAAAQINIPGTPYSFELDNSEWRYLQTLKLDDGANVHVYSYVGETLLEADGDTALPFLRIYINTNYSGDVYQLAYDRFIKQPFQSLNEFTKGPGLPRSGGLGYEGIYTNPSDDKDYRFLMTYFKDRRTIVEFRLETSRGTFARMEPKFKAVLSTIK